MTDHPCNCETCKTFDVTDEMDSCPFESVCGEFGMTITPGILSFIKIVGCLSHPKAREHMMKDVIAEMQKRTAIAMKAPDAFAQGYKNASEEISKLLQGDTK